MKNKIYVNALVGELVAPISATDTEIRIRALTLGALPTLAEGKWFTISLQEEYSIEVVKVTAVDIGLNTLTVERGFEGTTARQWADGTQWGTRLTATDAISFNDKQDALSVEDVKDLYESNPDTNAFTDVEKTKLGGIAENSTANATDAYLVERSNHTGTQAISTVTGLQASLDSKVDKVNGKGLSTEDFTTAEKTKLSGVATEATKNATDAQLRDRATHTGTQEISTVTGLQGALDSKQGLISTMPLAEIRAGSSTTARTITAKGLYDAASFNVLGSAATITPNLGEGSNFTVDLTHNATLGNPVNGKSGQTGTIVITHSGARTLSYGANWKFPGGAPDLSTEATTDIITYLVVSPAVILAVLGEDFS